MSRIEELLDFGRPLITPLKKATASSGWARPRPNLGHDHWALDIPTSVGTPVTAVKDGVVLKAENTPSASTGIYIMLQHDGGVVTRYLHLSKLNVARGAKVVRGQVIGYSGNTGDSEGPHLHFDVSVPDDLLPLVQAAVGKPKGGWAKKRDFGTMIPAEPWIPVDAYRDVVIKDAREAGIPLYTEHAHAVLPALIRAPQARTALLVGMVSLAGVLFLLTGLRRRGILGDVLAGTKITLVKVAKGLYRVKGRGPHHQITVSHRPWGPAGSQLPWVVTTHGGIFSSATRETRHSNLRDARYYIENVVLGP